MLMVAGALQFSLSTSAADQVCGDGSRDEPEQCDDGNLKSGDGCSSSCDIELCGNASTDLNEQCDDGNLQSNDGCNRYCQIEFCGDRIVQEPRGEECDDGNGIAGDGCSAACTLEGARPAAPPPPPPSPESERGSGGSTLSPEVVSRASAAASFLKTEIGEDYKKYLTPPEIIQLETILTKLGNGRRLNTMERGWAANLYIRLQEAKLAERQRYTDLLKQFIATPISSEVVVEKDLRPNRLVDVEVPVAIEELARAVDVIRRGELRAQVAFELARLRRQGIAIEKDIPVDYADHITPKSRPINVFATLKTLKEAAEKYATDNLPESLGILRTQAGILKEALPLLEREYGLPPANGERLLSSIETLADEVTKNDVERIVSAVNRFLGVLERRDIFTQADIALLEESTVHAAATAGRIAENAGVPKIPTTTGLRVFIDGLSQVAPPDIRSPFEAGEAAEQRDALLKLLSEDKRVEALRATMRTDGRTEFDERFKVLVSHVSRVGMDADTVTVCDDSMPDALSCTNTYLTELQDAVRGRSFFTRIVAYLQDLFRIGT